MDETTTLLEAETEPTLTPDDINDAFEFIKNIFAFFQNIIDTLAGFIQPVFEDLFRSIIG